MSKFLRIFLGREDEDNKIQENDQKLHIWHILKKSTHSFLGAWSFLLVHI